MAASRSTGPSFALGGSATSTRTSWSSSLTSAGSPASARAAKALAERLDAEIARLGVQVPPVPPPPRLAELRAGLELALMVGGPLLLAVLAVGVVVGLLQAATQVNEPTVAFVAKAIAMVVALAAMGSLLIGMLVDYTIALFQRIPQIVG